MHSPSPFPRKSREHRPPRWLESAVFYQIYPQSLYDTNGDGMGDIPGAINPTSKKLEISLPRLKSAEPVRVLDATLEAAPRRSRLIMGTVSFGIFRIHP
jgi:hypothetical protein